MCQCQEKKEKMYSHLVFFYTGILSVGIPGELRGMWAAYKRWGKLPWESLVTPTVEICRAGFHLSKINYDGFLTAPGIKNDPNFRQVS